MGGYWLTALVFMPLFGAGFVTLQISLYVFAALDASRGSYPFVELHEWIPQFGISYHIGVDGISLFLLLLTTILISISLLYSGGGDIEFRAREFCFFMLLLETG